MNVRRIGCILIILGVLFMSSCSSVQEKLSKLLMTRDERLSFNRLEQVVDAIERKDTNALKALFSKNALDAAEDFEENAEILFEFFHDGIISVEEADGPGAYESKNRREGKHIIKLSSFYYIQTEAETYFLLMRDYPIDTTDPKNVGLHLLLVVKKEEEDKIWDENEKILHDTVNGELQPIPRSGVYLPFK